MAELLYVAEPTVVFSLCLAATLLETALCVALEYAVPVGWRKEVSGSPLWSWYFGGFHQAVVFPVCLALALWPVFAGDMSFSTWIRSSFSDGTATAGCVWMHVALWAYWAKDCLAIKLSALIWAHHLVCLLSTFSSLCGFLPRSAGIFTLGAAVLELGSFANSVCEVQPGQRGQAVRPYLTPLMASSNATAIGLVVWYTCTFDGAAREMIVWSVAAAVGTALSVVRQQEWNDRVRSNEVGERFRKVIKASSS